MKNQREFNRRITMMQKTIQIKQDLKELLPEIEQDKYMIMLSHLCSSQRDRNSYIARSVSKKTQSLRQLTEAEKIFLDYLLKNNLNPKTTYRWFLVSKLPEDIKERLRKGQVNVAEARKIATNRIKHRNSNQGMIMQEEINNIIRSL